MKKFTAAAVGTIMMLFLGIFYAWSLFRLEFLEYFPAWTQAQTSLNFTIYIVMFCLGGLLGGMIGSRFGKRAAALTAACLVPAGILAMSFIGGLPNEAALWALYVCYGCVCGLGVGIAYITVISGFSAYFPDKPGFISGLFLTGFGLGSLLLGNLTITVSDAIGFFPALHILALAMFVVLLLGALLLDKKTAVSDAESSGVGQDYTPVQMLKTKAFWLLAAWSLLGGSLGLSVINSAAGIALSFGAPAALGLIVSLFNGLGRILMGSLFDRSKKAVAIMGVIVVGSGVLLTLSALTGFMPLMLAGVVGTGLGYGAIMAINAAFIKRYFGEEHYGENLSLLTLSGIPAAFIGPYVSGFLLDKSGGDYLSTFIVMVCFGAAGAVCLSRINN